MLKTAFGSGALWRKLPLLSLHRFRNAQSIKIPIIWTFAVSRVFFKTKRLKFCSINIIRSALIYVVRTLGLRKYVILIRI